MSDKHTPGPFIATLNAVLVDGRYDDILAIAVVANEEEGELWFGANKPDDGTQVDYVLHDIETMFAAPALLEACKLALASLKCIPDNIEILATDGIPLCEKIQILKAAIAQAEKD